jgi:cell wall-associated NlpC family hydrolase
MVGRLLKASLLLTAVAAFAATRPGIAEPDQIFDPQDFSAALTYSVPHTPTTPGTAAESTPPAAGAAEIAVSLDSFSSDDPSRIDPSSTANAEVLDPTEPAAATVPPAGATAPEAAASPAAAPGAATSSVAAFSAAASSLPSGSSLDSGELGIEYQLSVHDAETFLDRLSGRFKHLVEQAMTYLGTPYRRGGTSRNGLDCSGLTGAVYGEQGLDLPRTAAEQFREGVAVAESDLRPGDLVFFRDTYKRGISHVGIYIGDGRFLHAAGRRHGVIVSELSRPYYRLRFAGGRRPAGEAAATDREAGRTVSDDAGPGYGAAATLAAAPR